MKTDISLQAALTYFLVGPTSGQKAAHLAASIIQKDSLIEDLETLLRLAKLHKQSAP